MGVQSFQDTLLEKNARDHDSAGTRAAYDMIRDIGVPEVNIDLLVNLPGQTVMNFASSVRSVLELGPSCISFLDLHIPPTTTVFKKGGHYRPWREYLIRRAIYQRMLDDDGRYVRHRPHYYVLPDEAQGRTTRVTCTDTRAYQKGGLGYQLGIGMSARGHLGSVAYVNAINPAYEAIVRDGGLPLERSHVLREEDKIAMRAIRSAVDYCTFPGDPVVQQRYSRQLGFLRKYGLLDEDNNFTDDGCLFGEELGYMFYPMIEFPQDSEVSDAASWRDSRAASAAGWRAPT
jgi:coproporphyrinogen III oxidase-like Fe-S oxidoreductase